MAIKTELLREGQVILQTMTDPFDLMELNQNTEKLQREILDNAIKPIHMLIDATGVSKIPMNFLSGSTGQFKAGHPKNGDVIIVTSNAFFGVIINVFVKLLPQYKITVWKTLAEGWAEIDRILAKEAAN